MNSGDELRLLIVGDSITLGATEVRINEVVGRVDTSYVDILRHDLPDFDILVDAAVHRTTPVALENINTILDQHQPDIVLMMIGGNDADLDWRRFVLSEGHKIRNRVPVERYAENLRAIVERIEAAGASPILTDVPSHCFALRGPYISRLCQRDVSAWLEREGGQDESDKSLATYRLAVAHVAAETRAPLVRYGEALGRFAPHIVLGIDGVHPNAEGHRVIARQLLPAIVQARDSLKV